MIGINEDGIDESFVNDGKFVLSKSIEKARNFQNKFGWEAHVGFVAWIASWLLLRWLEHNDKEKEEGSGLTGQDNKRIIPEELTWQRVINLPLNEIAHLYLDKILSQPKILQNHPEGMLLQGMAPVFEQVGMFTEPAFEAMKDLLGPFDFSDPNHQKKALEILDTTIEQEIQRSRSAEFYTPQGVAEVMVELAEPKLGERIYDPCFGIGSLLVECSRQMLQQNQSRSVKELEELTKHRFFGVEINPFAYTIAAARIVLAGISEPILYLGDALFRGTASAMNGFDVILATPPWGYKIDIKKDQRYGHFMIPGRDSTNLFIQHVLQSLKPKGRAVIAVPEGTLFRGGADRKLREWILKEFKLDGVISLPPGVFAPFTNIKTSLLVVRRDTPADSIYLYDANKQILSLDQKKGIRVFELKEHAKLFKHRKAEDLTPVSELTIHELNLVVRDYKEAHLTSLLDQFCSEGKGVIKKTLGTIAQIVYGVPYNRSNVVERSLGRGLGPGLIGLVRITDIRDAVISGPSVSLNIRDSRISADQILKPQDIILSVNGTIGKMALVDMHQVNIESTISRSLVLLRTRENILPEYLFRILQARTYKEWLEAHAFGSMIKRLPLRVLRNLEIPVPSLSVQEDIVTECRSKNSDAVVVLDKLIRSRTGKEAEKIAEELRTLFFDELLPIISEKVTDPLGRLARFAKLYLEFFGEVDDDKIDEAPEFNTWVRSIMPKLVSIDTIPKGVAVYALLKNAWNELESFYNWLDNETLFHKNKSDDLAEKLTVHFQKAIDTALATLHMDPPIEIRLSDSTAYVGVEKEIQLTVINREYLPMLNLNLRTNPDVGNVFMHYLAELGQDSFTIKIPKQSEPGKFEFSLTWLGFSLDNDPLVGKIDLAIQVEPQTDSRIVENIGTSPYITGSPIDQPEMFFGRRDVIEKIRRQLSTTHRANVILLEGNRRSGKTSILYRLSRNSDLTGWIPVYCSFQGAVGHAERAGLPTREIFKTITRCIFNAVLSNGIKTWLPNQMMPQMKDFMLKAEFVKITNQEIKDENGFDVFQLYLQTVLDAIAPRKLLLMLDEFDKIQDGIETGVTSPQIPENIRYILHVYPQVTAILTYSKLLRRLREEYMSTLFGLGYRISVGPLSTEDAQLLVTKPSEGRLIFADKARDRVVYLCSRQPFLIQKLCNFIFDVAVETGQRTITESIVEKGAQDMTSDEEHFSTLWSHYVGSDRRRYILVLCEQLEHGPDPITFMVLENKLIEAKVFAKNLGKLLGEDLDYLRDLELISMSEGGSRYTLTIPLMASWIRLNIDPEGLRRRAIQESEESLQ